MPAVVTAAGVVTVTATGCTESMARPAAPPSADLAAAIAAARTERGLLADYDAAIGRHPSLAGVLGALRAQHAEHARVLVAEVPGAAAELATTPPATASRPTAGGGTNYGPTGTAGPSGAATMTGAAGGAGTPIGGGTTPAADDSPTARAGAVAGLLTAERGAATAHRAGCLAATAALAPLLASLYAAETAHVDLLGLVANAAGTAG
jgi:hypothetical protein